MPFRKLSSCLLLVALICQTPAGGKAAGDPEPPKAVYDYKSWDCRIKGDRYRLTVKHRLTINGRRGDDYRDLSIWETDFVKLTSVTARVLDAGGQEVYRREKDEFTKACGFGQVSLYSDACLYYTTLESSNYPYIVEYEYTLESRSLFFWRGVEFQHYIPVKYAEYRLTVPRGFVFNSKIYGLDIEPEVTEVGDEVRHLWTARDLPALEEIDYLPPGYNEGASIEFSADRFTLDDYRLEKCDWSEIGRWYNNLAGDRYHMGVTPVPGGKSADAARSIFNQVRKKTRYVSVDVGLSGWQPHSAAFTRERGYGDCKDMSTLLISRLRAQGIEAYPCLVLTKDNGLTDVAFPNFEFNHLIVMALVEDDTLWLDCTSDCCPYGDVPWLVENVDALVVTSAGGEMRRVAPSHAQDNRRERTVNIHIGPDRMISLNAELRATGNYAAFLRSRLESKDRDETRRFVNVQFDGAEKKYRIESYEIHNLTDLSEPVVIAIKASGLKPVRKIGSTVYCDPFVLDEMSGLEKADLEGRICPLYMYYPRGERSTITVTWDSSLAADSTVTPGDDSLLTSFGEIRLSSRQSGDTAYIELNKSYHVYQINPDQFSEFEAFRQLNRDIISRYVKMIDVPGK